jgi:replicative DNA helicase
MRIKYLPAQSTINDIRSYVKELEVQKGIKIECMCIDYLDLLMPVSVSVNPSDQYIKDKYASEELRNLAKELDIIMVTASQLNRTAVDESVFDHSHIAGGISKINTADNVFAIYTTSALREQGRYQLQLMKTRSSAGVGQNIDLLFDTKTLRITSDDSNDTHGNDTTNAKSSAIMSKIKDGVESVTDVDSVPKMKAGGTEIHSSDMKKLLKKING